MRTTAGHIAREAGVSPTTVDRVLNNRGGVRQRTSEIVMRVAEQLGYFGPVSAETTSNVRLDFVLPSGANSFLREYRRHLMEIAQSRGDCKITIHQVSIHDLQDFTSCLENLQGKTDAVGVVALDHPEVRLAIENLAHSGVRVCTMLSDVPSFRKVGYDGIDNRAAGRLAGMLVGRFLPRGDDHNVALFAGSMAYRGHEEREMGFRSILSSEYRNLSIVGVAEVNDDRDLAHQETLNIIRKRDISAIYSIGSGNQGIAAALREQRKERDIVFVGHDFTDATRALLLDRTMDAVIDQNAKVQAREILKLLVSEVKGTAEPQFMPRLQVVFRENIPGI